MRKQGFATHYSNEHKYISNLYTKSLENANLLEKSTPINISKLKCSRSACKFMCNRRQTINNSTYCCVMCKRNGLHGGRCEKVLYNTIKPFVYNSSI